MYEFHKKAVMFYLCYNCYEAMNIFIQQFY